jgi:hypothetical protein
VFRGHHHRVSNWEGREGEGEREWEGVYVSMSMRTRVCKSSNLETTSTQTGHFFPLFFG